MTVPAKKRKSGVIELLAKLQSGALTPEEITLEERRACVNYLRLEGFTQEEMAKIFGVHRATIGRDEQVLAERVAKAISDLQPNAVVGGLVAWAKHLTAKAMKAKNYALVWRIQKELADKLEDFGVITPRESRRKSPVTYVTYWGDGTPTDQRALPEPEEDDAEEGEYEDDEE